MRTLLFMFMGGGLLLACEGEKPMTTETDTDTDADTDSDTDADTDTDTDTDTDADTDTDTDTDTPTEFACPVESFEGFGTVTANLTGAPDNITPSCGFETSGADYTWEFSDSVGGIFRFDTAGSSFDTVLSIRQLCVAGELACNNDANGTPQSELVVQIVGGESYIIVVDAFSPATDIGDGAIVLNAQRVEICDDGSDNDFDGDEDCEDSECSPGPECCPLQATTIMAEGNYSGSIMNRANQTEPTCGGTGGRETTFEFIPPEDGVYRFDTSGSGFDTVLSVREECYGAELACDDNGFGDGATGASELDFAFTAGESYIITVDVVSAASIPTTSQVALRVVRVPDEICDDGLDNDGDGLTDCADVDGCNGDPNCTTEFCDVPGDDDADGLVDCFDDDCAGDPICGPEVCDDGIDNDTNSTTDCLDTEGCGADALCCPVQSMLDAPGTYTAQLGRDTNANDPSCGAIVDSPDTSWEFVAPADGIYYFDTDGTNFDTVLSLYDACGSDLLGELACNDDANDTVVFSEAGLVMTMGQSIIVHVESGTPFIPIPTGSIVLNVTQLPLEICDNDVDDSGEGFVDCFDVVGCGTDAACCSPTPINAVGTYTAPLPDDVDIDRPTCGLVGVPGFDVAWEFTVPSDGTYIFDATTSNFDAVMTAKPACGAIEGACTDGGTIQGDFLAGQSVVVHVNALDNALLPADPLASLEVREVAAEVCDDGLDNDGNGLADCLDTVACSADIACCGPQGTITMPGAYFGTLGVDVNAQQASCNLIDDFDTGWEFIPMVSGDYAIDTIGSGGDTVLSVDEGCGGPEIACNDDDPVAYPQSALVVSLTAGTSYIIHVENGLLSVAPYPVTLNIALLP